MDPSQTHFTQTSLDWQNNWHLQLQVFRLAGEKDLEVDTTTDKKYEFCIRLSHMVRLGP